MATEADSYGVKEKMLAADTEVDPTIPAETVTVTTPTVSVLIEVEIRDSAGETVTYTVSVVDAEQVASASLMP